MALRFGQYDTVRLTKDRSLRRDEIFSSDEPEGPAMLPAGSVGTVIETYENPPGYTIELPISATASALLDILEVDAGYLELISSHPESLSRQAESEHRLPFWKRLFG